MRTTKIGVIATATLVAGVLGMADQSTPVKAATQDNQGAVATESTSSAQQQVSSAQADVDVASTAQSSAEQAASQAGENVTVAQQQLTSATAAEQAAATKQSTAQASAATATAVEAAQTTANQANEVMVGAQKGVDSAQADVTSAASEVATKQAAVSAASQAVSEQTVTVASAQSQVKQDQIAVTAAEANSEESSVSSTEQIAEAESVVNKAKAAVDKTQQKIDMLLANEDREQGGITIPADYYQTAELVNQELVDLWDKGTQYSEQKYEQLYDEIGNYLNEKIDEVTAIDYYADATDYERVLAGPEELDFATIKELSEFAASIINDLRSQVGQPPVHVSDGSVQVLYLLVQQELANNFTNEQLADISEIFDQIDTDEAKVDLADAGIPMYTSTPEEVAEGDEPYYTPIHIQTDSAYDAMEDSDEWVDLNVIDNISIGEIKQKIMDDLVIELNAPEVVFGFLGGTSEYDSEVTQYLACSVDAYGVFQYRLIDSPAYDGTRFTIKPTSSFFNNDVTPEAFQHYAGLTDEQETQLNELYDESWAQTTELERAQAILAKLQASANNNTATSNPVNLEQLRDQLNQDQTALKQAQAALTSNQDKVQTASTELVAASAQLTTAKQVLVDAQEKLANAKQSQSDAQQQLSQLQGTINQATQAQQALVAAQAQLKVAQTTYTDAVNNAQATQIDLTTAKQSLQRAQARLVAAQTHLRQVQQQNSATHQSRTTNLMYNPETRNLEATHPDSQSLADVDEESNLKRLETPLTEASLVGNQNKMVTSAHPDTQSAMASRDQNYEVQKQDAQNQKIQDQKFQGQTLPQTNAADQSILTMLGLTLLGLLGLSTTSRKRRF